MGNSDLLTLIGIVIALAAYIATVRGRILDKARIATGTDKQNLKLYARLLMLADVPLIISGVSLSIYTAEKEFLQREWECFLNLGMVSFGFALLALVGFHIYEWYRSFTA